MTPQEIERIEIEEIRKHYKDVDKEKSKREAMLLESLARGEDETTPF